MKFMIELQRIGIFKFLGDQLKLWMVAGEAVDDFSITSLGPPFPEEHPALFGTIFEGRFREQFAQSKSSLHDIRIRVARATICIRRRLHLARAPVFDMASRTRMAL